MNDQLVTPRESLAALPVITERDKDPQASALYQTLKGLLDKIQVSDQDTGVTVFGNGRNLYSGHKTLLSGNVSTTVTIGITMPNTNYDVILTLGDGATENSVSYNTRTTTTFVIDRRGGTVGDIGCSWLVSY